MDLGDLGRGVAVAEALLHQAVQLACGTRWTLPSSLATSRSRSMLLELGQRLAGGDLLARLHVERTQTGRPRRRRPGWASRAWISSVQITLCGSGRKKNASSSAASTPRLV